MTDCGAACCSDEDCCFCYCYDDEGNCIYEPEGEAA
jgi:hypothetical protein